MRPRVLIAAAWLFACTPDQPTTPPEKWPDLQQQGREAPPIAPAGPDQPTLAPAIETPGPFVATPSPAPASSHDDPHDVLAPRRARAGLPGPRSSSSPGGCDGRSPGETWKADCNECSCGDDGQVTCTAMACGYR